ncbi:MAG: CoA protein activase [Syntrophomonadaceae bacterium]|nr:CoA protein activase [Syntrophomonadaceae bacterium]
MKVSFPRMGYSYLAFRWLMEEIGLEAVVPPEPNNETLDLGVRYSPEFACIPFKILMGSYLQAAEMGAEMIITSGGCGPCRAGYYWVMHQKLLDEIGCNVKVIGFEEPQRDYFDFIRKLNLVRKAGGASIPHYWRSIKTGWEKIKAFDDLEDMSYKIRPFEIRRGDTSKALQQGLDLIDQANDIPQVEQARREALQILQEMPQDRERDPLKVGIIGEIYVLLEPSLNHYMLHMLGEMGVQADRSIYLSGYTRENILREGEQDVRAAARPFLNESCIGGHGTNSIGETVLYAKHGYDGVIQLAPFSCIPEIVARSILPAVSRELDIPVLTFFLDEQTSKAGVETRLEAFIDLLEKRREKKRGSRVAPLINLPAGRGKSEAVPDLDVRADNKAL